MKSIFLKLYGPDIAGESTDKDHYQWIELTALTHHMRNPSSPYASTGGGHAVGRTEHGDINVTKDVDLASPILRQALSGGTTFQSAHIVFYRDAGDGRRVKYEEVRLKNVLISQFALGVGGAPLPTETLSLRYAAIEWKYRKQNSDGSQGGLTQGAWNLAQNSRSFEG